MVVEIQVTVIHALYISLRKEFTFAEFLFSNNTFITFRRSTMIETSLNMNMNGALKFSETPLQGLILG
jgi:hypothetical protein